MRRRSTRNIKIERGGRAVHYFNDMFRHMIPVLVATGTASAAIMTFLFAPNGERVQGYSNQEISTIRSQLSALQHEIMVVNSQIAAMQVSVIPSQTNSTPDQTTSEAIARLALQQSTTAEAVKKFEALMITDAERLVTLPLLQRDFQSLKDEIFSVKDNVTGLRSLVGEANSQSLWLIGTLALGILALVLPAAKALLSTTSQRGQQGGSD